MKNTEVIYTYEMNPLTMAVLSKEKTNGNYTTVVLEDSNEYTVFQAPTKMIDYACKFYGSSLRGRLDGTKDICNITHKAPIVIEPGSGMYFFPTASPQNRGCSWLAHSYIADINPASEGLKTAIKFTNGKRVIIDVSYGSMKNQLNRTAQFRYKLDERMKRDDSLESIK